MSLARCSEKGCPFPPLDGQDLCQHHAEMFAFDISLDGDAIEVDYANDPDEPARHRVSIVSAVEAGIERWRRKKQKDQDEKLFEALRQQKYRDDRRNAGVCIECGKPVLNTKARCENCLAQHKKRRKHLLAAGLCVCCARRPRQGKGQFCSVCRERSNKQQQKRKRSKYARNRSAGLCGICAKPVETPGRSMCQTCRRNNAEFRRQLRERKRISAATAAQ